MFPRTKLSLLITHSTGAPISRFGGRSETCPWVLQPYIFGIGLGLGAGALQFVRGDRPCHLGGVEVVGGGAEVWGAGAGAAGAGACGLAGSGLLGDLTLMVPGLVSTERAAGSWMN